MALRYVVLRHEGIPQPHFDLMFETAEGSLLATWRCDEWPVTAHSKLQRIAEHRRAYLELEGPLSGNRGSVRRIAAGTFQWDETKRRVILDEGASIHLGA